MTYNDSFPVKPTKANRLLPRTLKCRISAEGNTKQRTGRGKYGKNYTGIGEHQQRFHAPDQYDGNVDDRRH